MIFKYRDPDSETVPELLEELTSRYGDVDGRVFGEAAWQNLVRQSLIIYAQFKGDSEDIEADLSYDDKNLLDKEGLFAQLFELRRAFDRFLDAIDREKFNRYRMPIDGTQVNCLFISHRSLDSAIAERVASIAQEHNYDYWLDVHDPSLGALNHLSGSFPATLRSVLIAATIEIGLLNSTHVIALWSSRASGSEWIPYEYGRAKKLYQFPRGLWTPSAAMWIEDGQNVPDYAFLGRTVRTERALRAWLGGTPKRLSCNALTQSHALNHGR